MLKKTLLVIAITFLFFNAVSWISQANAADPKNPIKFKPQVTIDDKFNADPTKSGVTVGPNTIGEYINSIYKYAIGIVGILAVVVMMFGGLRWITAAGNAEAVGSAKAWIGAALSGLVLALTSYVILYTVNPDLVKFRPISPSIVEVEKEYGCCQLKGANDECLTTTLDKCKGSFYVRATCQSTGLCELDNGVTIGENCSITCNPGESNCGISCESINVAWTGTCINNCCVCTCDINKCNNYCAGSGTGICSGNACVCNNTPEQKVCTSDANCTGAMQEPCASNQIARCNTSTGQCYCANECEGRSDGYTCTGGFCYSDVCETGLGGLGDPCGNNGESTCVQTCPFNKEDWGSRRCVNPYECCEP